MKRIAVWVDGSEGSHAAVRWAAVLAKATGTRLVLVHALGRLPAVHDAPQRERLLHSCLESMSGSWSAEAHTLGVAVDVAVRDGDPRGVLLSVSEAADVDLVVVGRTGVRSGPGFSYLGSVVEHAVHHSMLPLAVVPPGWDAATQRIAVGIDGSAASYRALGWTAPIAAAMHATVVAVHVEEPILEWTPAGGAEGWQSDVEARWSTADAAGAEVLAVTERTANPTDGLLAAAARHHTQLIVIGTRSLAGPRQQRAGGVTLSVAHRATVPLVMVPVI